MNFVDYFKAAYQRKRCRASSFRNWAFFARLLARRQGTEPYG
jgi:hypothetical protein